MDSFSFERRIAINYFFLFSWIVKKKVELNLLGSECGGV